MPDGGFASDLDSAAQGRLGLRGKSWNWVKLRLGARTREKLLEPFQGGYRTPRIPRLAPPARAAS
eukprot:11344911-Alexandrium_andersonii.AAC.1